MPVVHSLSHVVVEDERSSKAPEVSYRRRRKKLKKISVAGDKQQKALTSWELPLQHHVPADASYTVG